MKVLGCDCSSKVIGCVMLSEDRNCSSVLKSGSKDMNTRAGELFFLFRSLLDEWEPDVVYIEQAIYLQNVKTTLAIDAVINMVRANCLLKEITYFIIDNRSWKKDVLGNGKASKEQIADFAKLKWREGFLTSQDEYDAACLAYFGQRRLQK